MMDGTLKGYVIKGCTIACAALLLDGCAPEDRTSKELDEAALREKIRSQGDGGMPAGAVAIGDNLYVAPVAVDEDGCEQFREWSTSGVSRQVNFFHDGEGSFSPIKSEDGSCNAEMIETGTDDEGCPTFQAQQPDGSSSEVPYYRYPNGGYTSVRERSTCEF